MYAGYSFDLLALDIHNRCAAFSLVLTKNNVKRGPEKNRNFEKSKNRKIEKIEKSKNRNFADRNFLFDYFSIFHCPEREGKGIAEILRKEYWNKD